jgi:hypothetical protein
MLAINAWFVPQLPSDGLKNYSFSCAALPKGWKETISVHRDLFASQSAYENLFEAAWQTGGGRLSLTACLLVEARMSHPSAKMSLSGVSASESVDLDTTNCTVVCIKQGGAYTCHWFTFHTVCMQWTDILTGMPFCTLLPGLQPAYIYQECKSNLYVMVSICNQEAA